MVHALVLGVVDVEQLPSLLLLLLLELDVVDVGQPPLLLLLLPLLLLLRPRPSPPRHQPLLLLPPLPWHPFAHQSLVSLPRM